MNIVIIGDGKVGFALAKQLSRESHSITLIDNNEKTLERTLEEIDVMVVSGNGASLDIQKEAGVAESDMLIAVTASDEINLLCCILAKKLGCRHTIPRVRNPEYAGQLRLLRSEYGLSIAVNPELSTAHTISRFLQFPSFVKLDSFPKSRVDIAELHIGEDSPLVGLRLDRLESGLGLHALVCCVSRGDEVYIPNGSFVIQENDDLMVTAPRRELSNVVKKLDIKTSRIRSVMIVGGGRIAEYLTEELLASGIAVKLIERQKDRCYELAERFPRAVIVCEDGTSPDVLQEEGINDTDAIVTLTGIDEQNLVISMFAKHSGVRKTITKINRTEYQMLFSSRGVESTVCPMEIASNEIIRYVRAVSGSGDGAVQTLYRIMNERVEALEFIATEDTSNIGLRLCEIKLRPDILIASINHNGNVIIPRGSDSIQPGDAVVVIARADNKIKNLSDIFAAV